MKNPFKVFEDSLKMHISLKAFNELPIRWSEPTRHYHNVNHLIDIIKNIEEHKDFKYLSVFEKQSLLLAAFFHDVIYDAKRKDNEDQSIKYFLSSYKGGNLTMSKLVCELIETTKYRKRPLDKLKKIFWESDNYKFKGSYENFLKNEKLIRKEFSFVPNEEYKQKRLEFLNSNLDLFGIQGNNNIKKLIKYVEKTY